MNFGIEKQYFEILNSLVIQPLKDHGAQVWIFGSRATGGYKKYSDVDLLFEISKELPQGLIFEITSAIEDSRFPYKVDLVERSKLALSYKDQVEKDKILL